MRTIEYSESYPTLIRDTREVFRRLALAASGAVFVEVEPDEDEIDDDRCAYCDERAGSCRQCQGEHAADLRGDD